MSKPRGMTGLALVAAVLAGSAARAESELVPAYPEAVLHGPAHAQGAVIWSHGEGPLSDEAKAPSPQYLALLGSAGWDIFRNNRLGELGEYKPPQPSVASQIPRKAAELSQSVDRLQAEGYRKIVLAELIDGLKAARVMVSFFRDDPYDPGSRGAATEASLAVRHVPHLVIDRPEIPSGHGGANGRFFARRFGPCVLALLAAPEVPSLAACASPSALEPSGAVPLPADLRLAQPAGHAPSDAFLGTWWGIYNNGREMMLAIEAVEGGRIQAVYAYGPSDSEKANFIKVAGSLADGRLVFAEPGRPRLEYRLEPAGTLEAKWLKGETTLVAHLRRLER
ncbi:MAG: hypothetical protein ACHQF3_03520 [Alphaproteobacteria bacterium]